MDSIKSIWDGWQSQFRNGPRSMDSRHWQRGEDCAVTYACALQWTPTIRATFERVDKYLRAHYDIPATYGAFVMDIPSGAIAYANNELGLTPDDFRRIDIETQIAEAVKPLVDSVELAERV